MSIKIPKYDELNSTQKMIIEKLNTTKKLAVIGGPGTGKTVIGLQAASLLAAKNKRSLLITYSRTLKNYIEGALDDFNINHKNIEINTYLRWFYRKLQILGKTPEDFQTKKFVYIIEKLEKLFDGLDIPNEEKYDTIIIDEAQDVQDGLIKIFFKFTKNIIITFDDSQKIGLEDNDDSISYDHSNLLLDLKIGDRFFDLIENYRNTKQIENVGKLFCESYDSNSTSLEKVTSNKTGEFPQLIWIEDNEKAFELLAQKIVNDYVEGTTCGVMFGIPDDLIGRTQIYHFIRAPLEKLCKEKGINFYFKWGQALISSSAMKNSGIFLMNIKSSKGLEFDSGYTITTYCNIDDYQSRNSIYVSLTRPKNVTNLIAFKNGKYSNAKLNEMLSNNDYIFKKVDLND